MILILRLLGPVCGSMSCRKTEIITVFNIEKYFDAAVDIEDRMDKYALSSYNNNDIRTKIYKGHKFVALFEWEKPFDSIFSYVGNDVTLWRYAITFTLPRGQVSSLTANR